MIPSGLVFVYHLSRCYVHHQVVYGVVCVWCSVSLLSLLVLFQVLVSEPLFAGWGWISQCLHASCLDIWRVLSLDGLWYQYTQADEFIYEGIVTSGWKKGQCGWCWVQSGWGRGAEQMLRASSDRTVSPSNECTGVSPNDKQTPFRVFSLLCAGEHHA